MKLLTDIRTTITLIILSLFLFAKVSAKNQVIDTLNRLILIHESKMDDLDSSLVKSEILKMELEMEIASIDGKKAIFDSINARVIAEYDNIINNSAGCVYLSEHN